MSRVVLALMLGLLGAQVPAAPPGFIFGDETRLSLDTNAWRSGTFRPAVDSGYLLCADTPWADASPQPQAAAIAPLHVVPGTGAIRFVFGDKKLNGSDLVTNDVRQLRIVGGEMLLGGSTSAGAVGTLACFATAGTGIRSNAYPGLFASGFESPGSTDCPKAVASGSCLKVRVSSITSAGGAYTYTYFIDYQLPAARAKYVIRDGFDPRLFSETTSWCLGSVGFPGCAGLMASSHNVDVTVAGSTGGVVTGRLLVQRTTQAGVGQAQLAAVSTPLVLAALFPEAAALELEPNLADNIGAGTATVNP